MKENRNVYYKARIWVDEEGKLHGISVCNRQLPMVLMNELNTKMHEVIDTANGKYEWRRTFYNFIHCGVEYSQYIPENFTPNYSMCKRCCFWDEGGKTCNHPHYLDGGKGVCHYPYRKVKAKENYNQKAIEICKEMQKWRRGEGEYEYGEPKPMPYTPTEFGEAIDELINVAEIFMV